MNDVKKKMLESLDRRAKRVKDRQGGADQSPRSEILAWLCTLEQTLGATRHSPHAFRQALDSSCDRLHILMRKIDPNGYAELQWVGDEEQDVTQLKITGVKIRWSDCYTAEHPGTPQEDLIDLSDVLFKD